MITKLWKEPFFHFVLIGLVLFLVYGLVNDERVIDDETILVTQGKLDNIAIMFEKTWQRQPTSAEMEGLIADFVKEEVFYREALRLGLDSDDIIIRRRMRQKMEFVAEDLSSVIQPTDQELEAYLNENIEEFMIPPVLSFRQIYINPERHSENIDQYIEELRSDLVESSTPDLDAMSDALMLGHEFRAVTPFEIARSLGNDFAEILIGLPVGEWVGPVPSGFGLHLIFIDAFDQGVKPQLAEVRREVERELMNDRRIEMLELFYQRLSDGYEIIIEREDTEFGLEAKERAK